jgi:hypothetical protein
MKAKQAKTYIRHVITFDSATYKWLAHKYPDVAKKRHGALTKAVSLELRRAQIEDNKEHRSFEEFRAYLESQELHLDMFAVGLLKHITNFLASRSK